MTLDENGPSAFCMRSNGGKTCQILYGMSWLMIEWNHEGAMAVGIWVHLVVRRAGHPVGQDCVNVVDKSQREGPEGVYAELATGFLRYALYQRVNVTFYHYKLLSGHSQHVRNHGAATLTEGRGSKNPDGASAVDRSAHHA